LQNEPFQNISGLHNELSHKIKDSYELNTFTTRITFSSSYKL